MEKVKVVFYIDNDGDVVAVFPFEKYDNHSNYIVCYAHIGQHSACNPEYVKTLTKTNDPNVYGELKKELEDIGYCLEIL